MNPNALRSASALVIDIILEDNHCLAINKPAGLLAQGDETGEPSVVDEAADYLKKKYAKPGNVFVGLVHRLDRPTSGALLLARTSKAAARLSRQFHDGEVEKIYWAIVEGSVPDDQGIWRDTLWKDERRNVVLVVAAGTPGGRRAELAYRIVERSRANCLLEIRPVTGRSHQIRAQLAARGLPVFGDRKSGATTTLRASDGKPRIGLHARSLTFAHPISREATSVSAPVPADWPGRAPGSP